MFTLQSGLSFDDSTTLVMSDARMYLFLPVSYASERLNLDMNAFASFLRKNETRKRKENGEKKAPPGVFCHLTYVIILKNG